MILCFFFLFFFCMILFLFYFQGAEKKCNSVVSLQVFWLLFLEISGGGEKTKIVMWRKCPSSSIPTCRKSVLTKTEALSSTGSDRIHIKSKNRQKNMKFYEALVRSGFCQHDCCQLLTLFVETFYVSLSKKKFRCVTGACKVMHKV